MKLAIFDIENWREIGATLARNKTRTLLTAFGIFWGTAMLAMLLGGSQGLEGIMRRQFAGFATNTGGAFTGTTSIAYRGFNKGMTIQLDDRDVANIRRTVPHIAMSTPVNSRSVTAVNGSHSKSTRTIGVESDYFRMMEPIVDEGRLINESDVSRARKVAVIGRNLASELFPGESPVGQYVSLNGVFMRIIGVVAQKSDVSIAGRIDESFIIPVTTGQRAFNEGNRYGFFIYTAEDGHTPAELQKGIRRAVSLNHPIHPADESAISFMDVSEMFETINNLFIGLAILAFFVGMGSLMAGVIGVGNIMWIIVKERTREIGIRRAIGARPVDIVVQILSESVLLTLVAGTSGVVFATIVLAAADKITSVPGFGAPGFEISFWLAVVIVATFFVLGSTAGTVPALKSMKIKPIEAMREK